MKYLIRSWNYLNDRLGLAQMVKPLFGHLVPSNATWWYVFGTATLFSFIVQIVTGITLATVYIPSTGQAYESLQFITNDAAFGRVLRGIHNWGAYAMIFFVGVHMIRVFLTAAYKFPREMSWLTGTFLFLLTVTMGFSGQILRWDQNAIWSLVVGAEQAGRTPLIGDLLAQFVLGGRTFGGATLSRWFSLHMLWIPAGIFAILGIHLYLVIRNGISEPPEAGRPVDPKTYRSWYENLLQKKGVPFFPNAAWRDVVFSTAVIVGIVLVAVIVGPPALGKPPDPTIIEANPRPDWYLLWYFAALALIPPGIENYFIIGAPLLAGIVLIALPFVANKGERHPRRRPWAIGTVIIIVVMVGTLWYEGGRSPWSPDFSAKPLPQSVIGASSGPVYQGAQVFHDKGCEYCHTISGYGGERGPNLSDVGNLLSRDEMISRILNGATNMPPFAGNISPQELDDLVAFLQTRKIK
jgi:ubiquinol-cytochrome c reductase cytochrome b subunit